MLYKRTEYFRFTFAKPLEAQFRILLDEGQKRETHRGPCQLLNLSPGGSKLFAVYNIPLDNEPIRITLNFTLHESSLEVSGLLVWKKPFKNGFTYGFEFDENLEMEKQVINELKLRRQSGVDDQDGE